ncbi:hypothetical protein HPB49_003804 [Dermacentor silvarum]|uniref:Uncharacterized protein n=1 Tax=Dermacentor silvarum TaxID=543639 RepID=A0ACB8D288_DERSI|nr:hypothetical protein HPB49_003804 [Dermacentor silvarum]
MHALVNARNPSLAYAKRPGSMTTVAHFNNIMMRVSLYRKQKDLCRECGRLGHRPDVCPRPDDKLCSACGAKNPAKDHECTPKCRLCGEAHPTTAKTCRAKFKTPYMVKLRRWTARINEEELLRTQSSPPSATVAAVSTPSTKAMEEEVEMVEKVAQQPGAKRKILETKTKGPYDSEAERKAQALKYDRRLAELEKHIS